MFHLEDCRQQKRDLVSTHCLLPMSNLSVDWVSTTSDFLCLLSYVIITRLKARVRRLESKADGVSPSLFTSMITSSPSTPTFSFDDSSFFL